MRVLGFRQLHLHGRAARTPGILVQEARDSLGATEPLGGVHGVLVVENAHEDVVGGVGVVRAREAALAEVVDDA